MNPFQQPGAFSWNELITPEPAAAITFYTEVLGWTVEAEMSAGIPYNTIKTAGPAVELWLPLPASYAPDLGCLHDRRGRR